MSVFNYLHEYQQPDAYEDPIHRGFIDELVGNLPKLGIVGTPISIHREVPLLYGNKRRGQADLVVTFPNKLYLVEAKVGRNPQADISRKASKLRKQLRIQLRESQTFFMNRFGVFGNAIGVLKPSLDWKMQHFHIEDHPVDNFS